VGNLHGDLLHYTYRDLSHNLQTIDRYSTFGAQKLFAAGRRACWYDITLRPVLTFFKKYLLCQGFRDGYPGLFIAVLTSYSNFAKYAKLWELQHARCEVAARHTRSDTPHASEKTA
jgi:hypothetical protein